MHSVNLQDVKDILECQICLMVSKSPLIYQCPTGHLFCQVCYRKGNTCPTCLCRLYEIRNLLAEKLLEKIPALCSFLKYGCSVILPGQDLAVHSKGCRFREVICPFPHCEKQISLVHMAEHVVRHGPICPASNKHRGDHLRRRKGCRLKPRCCLAKPPMVGFI